ncbi:MAG: sulfatase-like hydrolase/transferase [Lachnospiraceae bacterium]|nr:sulfatase-like hydrolase/transferase [Lachnospiraceae bacterium]
MKKIKSQDKLYNRKALIIQLIILTVLCFIVNILVESANWFQNSWGEISFATVVYQLSTPLEGTESGIIVSYVQQVIPKVVTKLLLALIFYYLLNRIFSVVIIRFHIKFFKKELELAFGKKFLVIGRAAFWLILITISALEIGMKVEALGIDDFVADIRSSSTIFEDYYIDPLDTDIVFPTEKRNLIFIYLESMENTYASVEAGGGKPVNYIPELTELAEENINISNTEYLGGVYPGALTDWTIAAILGSSSGIPYKIPGDEVSGENSAGKYTEFLPGLTNLGDILESEGYRNYFLCGSRGEFAGRDLYFRKHGNYEVMDYFYAEENGYIPQDYYVFWGYEDAKLFDIAKKRLGDIAASDEPFNFTMLTVDTHYPNGYLCELCENEYDETLANVIACSSRQTYNFVKWAMEQDWYENTTIILLGDHNSMSNNFWDDIGDFERRTYNCFINLPNGIDTSNVKNRNVCTLDIFPTTIAALGAKIDGDRLGLGTNVFSDRKTLIEELGQEYFDKEINRYSGFYNKKFVRNE